MKNEIYTLLYWRLSSGGFVVTDVLDIFLSNVFLSKGLDIWKSLVLHMAGGRRLDVHGVDIEFMRHQLG